MNHGRHDPVELHRDTGAAMDSVQTEEEVSRGQLMPGTAILASRRSSIFRGVFGNYKRTAAPAHCSSGTQEPVFVQDARDYTCGNLGNIERSQPGPPI